jgi:hypothetical protein
LVIGMYEGQDGELTADFLADVDAYTKSMSFGASLMAVSPPQMRTVPPESEEELHTRIAARKKTPWARRRMLAKVLLRMKQ